MYGKRPKEVSAPVWAHWLLSVCFSFAFGSLLARIETSAQLTFGGGHACRDGTVDGEIKALYLV